MLVTITDELKILKIFQILLQFNNISHLNWKNCLQMNQGIYYQTWKPSVAKSVLFSI